MRCFWRFFDYHELELFSRLILYYCSVEGIEKINNIRERREGKFIMHRLNADKAITLRSAKDTVRKHISVIKSPAAGLKVSKTISSGQLELFRSYSTYLGSISGRSLDVCRLLNTYRRNTLRHSVTHRRDHALFLDVDSLPSWYTGSHDFKWTWISSLKLEAEQHAGYIHFYLLEKVYIFLLHAHIHEHFISPTKDRKTQQKSITKWMISIRWQL